MRGKLKGFYRLEDIVGSKKRGVEPMIPISSSAWRAGVASGKYPKPVKLGRINLWTVETIEQLINDIAEGRG